MARTLCFALLACVFHFPLYGQEPAAKPVKENQASTAKAPSPSCLIVKHKGTVGRRLLWTAVIGVPIAPGAKYDLVDSINFQGAKMNYKGKELEQLQAQGIRVIVLENKYTAEDVESARKACREIQGQEQKATEQKASSQPTKKK